jgi:hypothetical protein
MMKYNELIKAHLASYKSNHLRILQDGIWKNNNKKYKHILPEPLYKLNIIETFREEFWEYFETGKIEPIKKHQDFHHLNSSQAMAFNLFFPFIYSDKLSILIDSLEIGPCGEILENQFEKIKCREEGTNFDFFIRFNSNINIFFELKFSENEFGGAINDASHLNKYENIYKPALKDIIIPEYRNIQQIFQNYQIIRNLIYLGRGTDNYVIFIFPEQNCDLKRGEKVILDSVSIQYKNKVKIIYLENLVRRILSNPDLKTHNKIITHFELFQEKYILM